MTTTRQILEAVDVRDRLTTAIRMDLIGPMPGEPETTEILPKPPSKWYLMTRTATRSRAPFRPAHATR